jgi:uncharacterized membrane protein YfcA
MPLEAAQLALVTVVMVAACALQSAVGFGSALIAAPILMLIDPVFVPGPLLCASFTLSALMTLRERRAIDVRGVSWALAGRVPGTALGVWLLTALPVQLLSQTFAGLIMLGVALTALGPRLSATPRVSFSAGMLSGVMGTVTSAGGPPLALLHQGSAGPALRATLASYFLIGSVISMVALASVGRLGARELAAGASLLPGVTLGFLVAGRARAYLDAGRTRPAVLAVSALSALLVVLEQL